VDWDKIASERAQNCQDNALNAVSITRDRQAISSYNSNKEMKPFWPAGDGK
jgi:hypothetical protein